jgi:hypothetical protein
MVVSSVMPMPATSTNGPAVIMIAPCRFLVSMRPIACSSACVTS